MKKKERQWSMTHRCVSVSLLSIRVTLFVRLCNSCNFNFLCGFLSRRPDTCPTWSILCVSAELFSLWPTCAKRGELSFALPHNIQYVLLPNVSHCLSTYVNVSIQTLSWLHLGSSPPTVLKCYKQSHSNQT